MNKTIVKLYGLNHSGSHYLSWLLNHNFNNMVVLHSHTGWNHGNIVTEFNWDASKWNSDPYFKDDLNIHGEKLLKEPLNDGTSVSEHKDKIQELYNSKTLPILALVRNPYTWLHSYCVKHFRDGGGRDLARAMKLWSDINRNYKNTDWENKKIIKYETLRDSTESVIKDISIQFGFDKKPDFIDTDKDAILLHRKGIENHKYRKTSETDYSQIINTICAHEGISHETFSKMFKSLIDANILDWYNKL